MKKTKHNDLIETTVRENQEKEKPVWQKPSLSFIGKLKEIVQGPTTSGSQDGITQSYRP